MCCSKKYSILLLNSCFFCTLFIVSGNLLNNLIPILKKKTVVLQKWVWRSDFWQYNGHVLLHYISCFPNLILHSTCPHLYFLSELLRNDNICNIMQLWWFVNSGISECSYIILSVSLNNTIFLYQEIKHTCHWLR
jgi:hypothetical protein